MKVLQLASFSGNIGDNAHVSGLRNCLQQHLGSDLTFHDLEIRRFYKSWNEANFDSDLGGGGPGGGGPGGSLYGLKPFVAERGNFVDGAIDCATVSIPRVETVDWALFPNPAHNQLHITFNDNFLFEFGWRNPGEGRLLMASNR